MAVLEVYQAVLVLLSEWPTEPVEALFFHGRSYGDDDGLFEIAADLSKNGIADCVVVNGSNGERVGSTVPREAWPGKDEYTERLKSLGVENIVYSAPAFTTRHENDVFLNLAFEKSWTKVCVLCQPHQALRTMLGFVKAMIERDHFLRIYTVTPESTSWSRMVHGSQGAKHLTRFEHIEEEWRRIENSSQYRREGVNLATFEELLGYLRSVGVIS
jgi:hypothetical protein